MNRVAQNTEVWDSFWQAERLACCIDSAAANYAADFKRPWLEFFQQLQDGDSLLDLCTGNGAIPLIALDHAKQHKLSLDLHGVDSADINPGKYNPELGEELSKITFHPRTFITELPFGDDSFDFATSQYGIEYAPLEPAAAEIVRVLRRQAHGQVIMHAEDGVTALLARKELVDIDELFNDIDIFSAASIALRLVHNIEESKGKTSQADIERAKAAFDNYHARLTKLGEIWQQRTAGAVFRSAGDILQHTFQHRHLFSLQQLLDKVDESKNAVLFHKARLEALLSAAKRVEDCAQIEALFLSLGCSEAHTKAVHDQSGNNLLGWRVNIRG